MAAAIERAGVAKPNSGVERAPSTLKGQVSALVEARVGQALDGLGAGEPTRADAPDLAVESRKTEELAEDVARAHLAELRGLNKTAEAAISATNGEQSEMSEGVVVARVSAPQSLDAEGKKVDTTLTVEGDVVTMHVDHRGEDVTYPIAADPEYTVIATRWNLMFYPEMVEEQYVHHYESGQRHIGNWHPVYCVWGIIQCAGAGAGWFHAWQSGVHHAAYWPGWDWGPAWQD